MINFVNFSAVVAKPLVRYAFIISSRLRYCPFLKSQYLFLYGIPASTPNILNDYDCAVGGQLADDERLLAGFR